MNYYNDHNSSKEYVFLNPVKSLYKEHQNIYSNLDNRDTKIDITHIMSELVLNLQNQSPNQNINLRNSPSWRFQNYHE